MLFRKNQERCCTFCVHATQNADGDITCAKQGSVSADHSCWKFTYDPCKRVPLKPKAPDFAQYNADDCSL